MKLNDLRQRFGSLPAPIDSDWGEQVSATTEVWSERLTVEDLLAAREKFKREDWWKQEFIGTWSKGEHVIGVDLAAKEGDRSALVKMTRLPDNKLRIDEIIMDEPYKK